MACNVLILNTGFTFLCLSPTQANILKSFESLEKLVKQHYSTEDQYIVSCPTQEEVRIVPSKVHISFTHNNYAWAASAKLHYTTLYNKCTVLFYIYNYVCVFLFAGFTDVGWTI